MAVPAGLLNHWITLQNYQTIQNPDTGSIEVSWHDIGNEWAAVQGVHGREFLGAGKENATATWRVIIRHREVKPSWRILVDGMTLDIEAVLPDNRSSQLVLMCKTVN